MPAISIGPLLFAGERLAAILGIAAFLVITAALSWRNDSRLAGWAQTALLVGFVAARLAHVALNAGSFLPDPWRIIMFWQGGFNLPAGLLAAALTLILGLRQARSRLASLAALVAGLLVWNVSFQLVAATTAVAAPDSVLTRLDGQPTSLKAHEGKPVVLNLWASWCPPCRREMPMMTEMANSRKDVDFVFANQGESAPTIETFLRREGLSSDHIVLDEGLALARHYGVQGYPTTLFLDRTGMLVSVHSGEISPEVLGAQIEPLLAETAK